MPLTNQAMLYSQLSPAPPTRHNLILPRLCSLNGTGPTVFPSTGPRIICRAVTADHHPPITRRTANYQPNSWDYNFMQSLTNGFDVPTDSTTLPDTVTYYTC